LTISRSHSLTLPQLAKFGLPAGRSLLSQNGQAESHVSSCYTGAYSHPSRTSAAKVPGWSSAFISMQLSGLQDLPSLPGSFLQPGSSPPSFHVPFFLRRELFLHLGSSPFPPPALLFRTPSPPLTLPEQSVCRNTLCEQPPLSHVPVNWKIRDMPLLLRPSVLKIYKQSMPVAAR